MTAAILRDCEGMRDDIQCYVEKRQHSEPSLRFSRGASTEKEQVAEERSRARTVQEGPLGDCRVLGGGVEKGTKGDGGKKNSRSKGSAQDNHSMATADTVQKNSHKAETCWSKNPAKLAGKDHGGKGQAEQECECAQRAQHAK